MRIKHKDRIFECRRGWVRWAAPLEDHFTGEISIQGEGLMCVSDREHIENLKSRWNRIDIHGTDGSLWELDTHGDPSTWTLKQKKRSDLLSFEPDMDNTPPWSLYKLKAEGKRTVWL